MAALDMKSLLMANGIMKLLKNRYRVTVLAANRHAGGLIGKGGSITYFLKKVLRQGIASVLASLINFFSCGFSVLSVECIPDTLASVASCG